MTTAHATRDRVIEAPTLLLICLSYGLWASGLWLWASLPLLALAFVVVAVVLHASLQHECIHGHPTPWIAVNRALVYPSLNLVVPYGRFRDTHLAHHMDQSLTDPYDDPESNFMDPAQWVRLARWRRGLLRANNTLLGRMMLGPVISQVSFMGSDWQLIRAGDARVRRSWIGHGVMTLGLLGVVWTAPMPLWVYLCAAYVGLSILKIRTFLEHRAHAIARARTVIVEDRGPLAFLFLNNNLHAVHHMHPGVPWYDLPARYRAGKARYRACNEHYVYRSYWDVARAHLLRPKDPVPHPLWPQPDARDMTGHGYPLDIRDPVCGPRASAAVHAAKAGETGGA